MKNIKKNRNLFAKVYFETRAGSELFHSLVRASFYQHWNNFLSARATHTIFCHASTHRSVSGFAGCPALLSISTLSPNTFLDFHFTTRWTENVVFHHFNRHQKLNSWCRCDKKLIFEKTDFFVPHKQITVNTMPTNIYISIFYTR